MSDEKTPAPAEAPLPTVNLERILRGAGSDALTYFPVRFLPALTSLVTVPVFTANIDPADYGFFYLISSATSLATTLAVGWISPSVIRYYWPCEKEDRGDQFTATTLWVALASLFAAIFVLGAIVLLALPHLEPGLVRLVPVALASMLVASLVTVLQQIQRAANRAKSFARIANSVTIVTTAVAVALVAKTSAGALGILVGTLSGNLLVLPIVLRRVAQEGSLSPKEANRELAAEYLSYGVPIMLANISSWALVLSDRYIIQAFRDAAEVGLYSVTYGLGDKIMQLFIAPLTLTMGPVMVQTFEKQGQHLAEKVQTQFTRYFLLVTVPLLAGIAAASEEFMIVFTNERYQEAYPILAIVAAGALCYGLTQIAGVGVSLHKKSKIIMTNTLIAALFQIGLNLVLVPRYGYMAAAWTTLASYVLLLSVTWLRSRPYMAWHIPWLDVARIAGSSIAMWLLLVTVFATPKDSVWLLLAEAALGVVVYTVLALLTGAVRPSERQAIGNVAKRLIRRSS